MGNVANAVIESVSLTSFPRVDGVILKRARKVAVVVERPGMRCLRWYLSPDATFMRVRDPTWGSRCCAVRRWSVQTSLAVGVHLGWHRHLPTGGSCLLLGKLGAANGKPSARSMRWNKVLQRDTWIYRHT